MYGLGLRKGLGFRVSQISGFRFLSCGKGCGNNFHILTPVLRNWLWFLDSGGWLWSSVELDLRFGG